MRCFIRTSITRGDAGSGYQDHWLETATVTLGRGTDQDIHVNDHRVALHHARLTQLAGGRGYALNAVAQGGLRVNGQPVSNARLDIGDVVEIGNLRLTLLEPPDNADLALELSVQEEARDHTSTPSALFDSSQTLAGHFLHRRRLSWWLFSTVFLLFLVLPLCGFLWQPLQDFLRAAPLLPSDHAWDSGAMTSAHRYFGQRCNVCHNTPFTPVGDETCVECHGNIQHHVTVRERQIQGTQAANCTRCHREHNGHDGMVVNDARLCGDCHQQGGPATTHNNHLLAASNFSTDHPQFRVSLERIDAGQHSTEQRLSLDHPGLRENTQLNFPHDVHLDPQGVDSPDGETVLHCDDCHRTDAGGGLMQPIEMESHCLHCHRLELDPNYPQREVPHGKPEEVLYVISEYFSRLAVEGAYWSGDTPAIQFDSTAQARDWAHQQARLAGQRLFEDRACGICHEVQRQQSPQGLSWHILPARITHPWFPHARFKHQTHQAMACTDCHSAETSTTSSDVLMPGIDTCRRCHLGQGSRSDVLNHSADQGMVSPCVTCHVFHLGPPPPNREAKAINTGLLRNRPPNPQTSAETPSTPRRRPGG